MTIFEYLKKLKPLLLNQEDEELFDHQVSIFTDNSKLLKSDGVFFSVVGVEKDGHCFIDEAVTNGAKTIIYQHDLKTQKKGLNYLKVENVLLEYNKYLLWKNQELLKNVKVIGITGTNGKTTVASIAYNLLKYRGLNVGYVGTNGTFVYEGRKNYYFNTPNTTPKLEIILNVLEKHPGLKYLILEVSSEALKAKRLNNLTFDIVVFTNLGHDHLNTHITVDDYLASKLALFGALKKGGIAIINEDDLYAPKFRGVARCLTEKIVTFGLYNGDLKGEVLRINKEYMMCKIMDKDVELIIGTNLLGKFNLLNILAALLIMQTQGFELITLIDYFSNNINISGRYQFEKKANRHILIDYAHNPEAIKEILTTINQIKGNNKLITIIGAGGKKDKEKRPLMGRLASEYSDFVIYTEDTSRGESLKVIIQDLIANVTKTNYEIIFDRVQALKKGFAYTKTGDYLAVLGMGNDSYGPNNDLTDLTVIQSLE